MHKVVKVKIVFSLLLLFTVCGLCFGQGGLKEKKWFVVLPLRFTQLQNSNTMLSGIKVGRSVTSRFNLALSIYHSFYLNSFKAKAHISGFDESPRLFINCMGTELEYYLHKRDKISLGIQLLVGWGFMKYDSKKHGFSSEQVNYLALEPTMNSEYRIGTNTYMGLGLGLRALVWPRQIAYTSEISSGYIPVEQQFSNRINLILSLKGCF